MITSSGCAWCKFGEVQTFLDGMSMIQISALRSQVDEIVAGGENAKQNVNLARLRIPRRGVAT